MRSAAVARRRTTALVISRGEQDRYGWRRRTLLTARLMKLYGGLRLMKKKKKFICHEQ